jgi:hypothetical protein
MLLKRKIIFFGGDAIVPVKTWQVAGRFSAQKILKIVYTRAKAAATLDFKIEATYILCWKATKLKITLDPRA